MRRLVLSPLEDASGATAIEYSLIAAGIALVIVAAVNSSDRR
jgi:Flp pilus assembly pilin Flp